MCKPKMAVLALYRGGIGHYISELTKYLKRDFDLFYISYKYGLPGDLVTLDDPAIAKSLVREPKFIVDYNNYKDTVNSLGQTVKYLKDNEIEILNVHVSTMTRETVYFVITLINVARRLGMKVHFTIHDVGSFENYAGGQDLLKTFYSLFDSATVGNENELKMLIDLIGAHENIQIARHGLYGIFDFNKYNKETARKYLGIPLDKKVILNFGILRDYKGFDDTVAAMPDILKVVPEAYLNVSAGVRVHDCSGDIKKLVKSLKLSGDVKLDFDFVLSDQIEPIFKAADIVVLPYKQVSQSGILNIAFNFCKPVIISDLFAEAKLVNNKMGIVVKPGDKKDLVRAIISLLGDQEQYISFETNMKQYVKNDTTWESNAGVVKDIIFKVLEEK